MRPSLLRLLPVLALALPAFLLGTGKAEARRQEPHVRTAVHSHSAARHSTHRVARHTPRVAHTARRAVAPAS